MKGKMAIIGDGEGALVFRSVGMDAYAAEDAAAAARLIRELAERYQVIFVTDVLAAQMEEVIIVPIPSVQGGNGYGAQLLRSYSERALGMDITRGGRNSDGENNAR